MSPVSWLVWHLAGALLPGVVCVPVGEVPGSVVAVSVGIASVGAEVEVEGDPAGTAGPASRRGWSAHPVATVRARAAATASAVTRIGGILPGHLIIGFDVDGCDAPGGDLVHGDVCQVGD